MNIDLSGKRALVCGASKGIGRAIAFELAHHDCKVTVLSRSEEPLKTVCSELKPVGEGRNHSFIACDTANISHMREMLLEDIDRSGIYHILINNSGGPPGGPIEYASIDEFEKAFRQHVLAGSELAQMLLGGMKQVKYGRIINIISTSVKAPIFGLGVSNTIRAAMANWSKTLAMEVASEGVTVNSVLPGFIDTERLQTLMQQIAEKRKDSIENICLEKENLVPAKRFGTAKEVANAVAFLASPAASYINGVALAVDGGRTPCL